jgi:hypothetical protein
VSVLLVEARQLYLTILTPVNCFECKAYNFLQFFIESMKKKFTPICLTIFILVFSQFTCIVSAVTEQDNILSSAESLFKLMKEKNYQKIWFYLSNTSRNSIINDTYKSIVKYEKDRGNGVGHSREQLGHDFSTGGPVSQVYWKSYLEAFNPDIVLEQSRWEMGKIGQVKAYINVTYRKSARPAVIQMFKEDGYWRVGLIETFSTSKR